MSRALIVAATCAVTVILSTSGVAVAQQGATFVLRSGERVSGELVDMSRDLDVNVGGQNRRYSLDEVVVIDFAGNGQNFPQSEVDQVQGHTLVLRDGRILRGSLYDVGGTRPLRISFSVDGTTRDFMSSDVARIYLSRPSGGSSGGSGGTGLQPPSGAGVSVSPRTRWVNTGIVVSQGQTVNFNATGEVRLSGAGDDLATPAGSKSGRYAPGSPLPQLLAGALIGRIGNGQPFGIGDQRSVQMPASGPLFLGVNDDQLNDNEGEFRVDIQAGPQPRRRR
jgi:hypothetical protein